MLRLQPLEGPLVARYLLGWSLGAQRGEQSETKIRLDSNLIFVRLAAVAMMWLDKHKMPMKKEKSGPLQP